MKFEFATATRVIFGTGTLSQAGSLIAEIGRRVLIVSGSSIDRIQPLTRLVQAQGIAAIIFPVTGEPTLEIIRNGTVLTLEQGCDVVVAMGGGSVLDTGKAIAAMTTNPGDILDYLEVIGGGKSIGQPGLPFIAIPTTAGTGTEVTRNAVIGSQVHGIKVSLRSLFMLPRIALVDPELTYSLPGMVTATSGMDALTQLIEPFTCNQPNPIVDAICRDGINLIARFLEKAYRNGKDTAAREAMSLAGLYGGMALANARLGAVHGFAGPIGGVRAAPHGAVCARLLPIVMEFNIKALREREPESGSLVRYHEIARILTGDRQAEAEAGVEWIYGLRDRLEIPPISKFGFSENDITDLEDKSSRSSSMKGNPIQLTLPEMEAILRRAL